jgi:hypothetical protein
MIASGLVAMWVAVSSAAPSQVFRSAADVVTVDVAVRDGNRPVASLAKADFVLLDNDVAQVIDSVSYGTLPIDVRLLVDLSGSISADQLARHESAIRQLQGSLNGDDRCEVSTFARRVTQVAALGPPPVATTFTRPELDGTSYFDAALLAMITASTPGRRQLTLLLTDGIDSASFYDEASLTDAAKRTDAVVNVLTAIDRNLPLPVEHRLESIAKPTGGRLLTIKRNDDIGPTLTKMVADFRQSYVLTYTPTRVARDGWHAITVTAPGTKYTIRARQGYFGG